MTIIINLRICDWQTITIHSRMKKLPIGDNIRLVRNRLGYSQEYVAERLGISKQRYRQLENEDQKSLTIGRILEIAIILQTDIETLFSIHRIKFKNEDVDMQPTESQLDELLYLIKDQKVLIDDIHKNMKS
ncbi:hypothetical protein DSL64_03890 [Dyadobacter luteus]|uniref:HTH cro/C1-type domain-containing protein n=2 Tax=Dyadobacter luteus TaxID=2259619 RepID=A0A3D8YGB2_9BACT|nr:hypothetical protein DSL64_03890 [Dyadobacter luteus]